MPVGKRAKGNRCTGGYLFKPLMADDGSLLTIKVLVNGKETRALVNIGYTTTLIHSDFSNGCKDTNSIKAVNGKEVACREVSTVTLEIRGRLLRVKTIVMSEMIEGVDIIVGMDVISRLGEVTVNEDGTGEVRGVHCAVSKLPASMRHRNSGLSPCKI